MSNQSNYQVGGSISAQTSVYIAREADEELFDALQSGELCYVFNSRQMGKSSLLVNVKSRLQSQDCRCCFVDMSRIGSVNASVEQWYAGIVSELWRGFGLAGGSAMLDWWRGLGEITPAQKLFSLLQHNLIEAFPDSKLVIFFDEVDSVLSLPFAADDFFSVVRACYNLRADDSRLENLCFAFFGVALPSDLVSDKTRSPFNIGTAIELEGFSLAEAMPLAGGLQVTGRDTEKLMAAVIFWSNGQPFLTQKICQIIASNAADDRSMSELSWVDELVERHIISDWVSKDNPEHLRTIADRMLLDVSYSTLNLSSYAQLLAAEGETIPAVELGDYSRLYLTGLIAVNGGMVSPRTAVYRRVFDEHWLASQLEAKRPYAEKMRQWQRDFDEQWLLRGGELAEAIAWAEGKHLPELDHRFIADGQALENREFQQWNQRLQTEVDQRKLAEQQLQSALDQLELAKQEAEQANRAKTDFLARVSHEVRTPIHSVMGLSHLALQQELGEVNRDYLQKIQRSSNYLLGVVNDIVDIGMVERGELSLSRATFLLDDVLDKLVDVVAPRIADKSLTLELRDTGQLLPALVGDANRLLQLLLNLCTNAIKHTRQGGICLSIEIVERNNETLRLKFMVADSGQGFARQTLRGKVSRDANSVLQPGLGLSLCCELASLMNGELYVESEPGEGSRLFFAADFSIASQQPALRAEPIVIGLLGLDDQCPLDDQMRILGHQVVEVIADDALDGVDLLIFPANEQQLQGRILALQQNRSRLRLVPLVPAGTPLPHWLTVLDIHQRLEQHSSLRALDKLLAVSASPELVPEVGGPLHFSQSYRVLVAEDDEINQLIVKELLLNLGLQVDLAGDGAEALEALVNEVYDLVLMDIEMPVMGGLEAISELRAMADQKTELHRLSDLPVIAMTAHAMVDDRKRFLAAGMNDYITKPLEPAGLAQLLAHWLDDSSAEREQGAAEPVTTNELNIEGVDTANGLLRCGGNSTVYLQLLGKFAVRYSQGVAFAGHDLAAIAATAHAIKGSSANLGLVEVSGQAAVIESSCRQGQIPAEHLLLGFSHNLQAQCRHLAQLTTPAVTTASPITGVVMNKPRILVVDDQPDNIRLLMEILKSDYTVLAATNGPKALQLAAAEPRPVAILQDIQMPEMDGFDVCEQLKANPQTAGIPLLFVTGSDDEQDYQRGLALGAIDFVSKPVSAALLTARLKRCLKP